MPTFISSKTFADDDYLTFTELNAAMGDNGALHWDREALRAIGVTADSGAQSVRSAAVSCRVYGGEQQIPDSKWTAIAWSNQRWGRWNGQDIDYLLAAFPTFVHLPIVPEGAMRGHWKIGAHIAWAGNTTGARGVRIVSHGNKINLDSYSILAAKMKEATAAGAVMRMSLMTLDAFNAGGGSYAVQVWQDSGDSLGLVSIPGASPECWAAKRSTNAADRS